MQVRINGTETVIKLTVREQRRLSDAKDICSALSKHDDSDDAKKSAELLDSVVEKYGTE